MAIVRLNPVRDILSMGDAMDRFLMAPVWNENDMMERGWVPACDIHETESSVVVDCELPGLEANDIDINIEGNTMTVTGERVLSSEINREDYHRIERTYGSFTRVLTLPAEVNADKCTAAYENGVLEITLPKLTVTKPKSKKVKVTQAKAQTKSQAKTQARTKTK